MRSFGEHVQNGQVNTSQYQFDNDKCGFVILNENLMLIVDYVGAQSIIKW